MSPKIDSHQHFWNPARGDYNWMPMANATLARAYGPADLEPHLVENRIEQTVLVQAAATLEETEYLLRPLAWPAWSAGSISRITLMRGTCAGWQNTQSFWGCAQ